MEVLKQAEQKTYERTAELIKGVEDIINNVKQNGDDALKELSRKFDGIELDNIKISQKQIKDAYDKVSPDTVKYLKFAASLHQRYLERGEDTC